MFYKDKLKFLREEIELTQKEIANILGISNSRYSFYENETDIIPINHLINLCNFLNVSIDYIFSFTNIKQYKNNNNQEIDKKLVGERLKQFRKDNKITQKKMAEILNTVQQVISKYEKGINLIATPFLYTICKKYNISADYLLGKIDTPKYFN